MLRHTYRIFSQDLRRQRASCLSQQRDRFTRDLERRSNVPLQDRAGPCHALHEALHPTGYIAIARTCRTGRRTVFVTQGVHAVPAMMMMAGRTIAGTM